MAKKKSKMFFLILYLLYLIGFSNQQKHEGTDDLTTIDFDANTWESNYEVINAKKSQRFRVSFVDKTKSPFYMKIEVTSTDDKSAPVLCFSSTDQNCDEREQIVKNPNGKSNLMWLRRDQYDKEEENLYIKVICPEEGAGYILSFTGGNEGGYDSPNFVYSYLVTSDNKEMEFNIKGNEKTGILLIVVQGNKSPTLTADKGQTRQIENGYVIVVRNEYETSEKLVTVTVKGTVDDYITLTSHLINSDEASEILEPNGPEIGSYLENGAIEEDCYKISSSSNKLYLTGRFQSMYGLFYLKDQNQRIIESSKEEVRNGHLSKVIDSSNTPREICIGFPESSEIIGHYISFTLSLSEPANLNSLYNFYPPQIPGKIYRRYLPKGHTAYYYPMELDKTAKKYNFNVYSIKGYSKMGIAKCSDYPYCQYNNVEGLDVPKTSNQMSIWTSETVESSTLGKTKNVIVVQCIDDDNESNGYCLFETSFISKEDTIDLVPNEKFSNYVIDGEKGTFKLNIGYGIKALGLIVDIMIFSGDVSFNLKVDGDTIDYHKYYLSNKVLFILNLEKNTQTSFNIEFIASLKSFFTIQYEYNTKSLNQLEEIIPSGESYLVQIDPTSTTRKKTIHLQNFRYKKENPFLANFFALNCEFEVNRGKEVTFFDGYAQEILTKTSTDYKSETYDYEIKITEPDLSNYNHKMCMLYVGGIESDDDYQKEFIVSENINQQIIFNEEFKKVRFLYPQADNEKDLAINVNVIDQAIYQLNIYVNNNNRALEEHKITRTQILYLSKNDISSICKANKLCPIIVEVEYVSQVVKTEPMIEVTIRQIKNIPSYLQKGIAKRDFTCGDNFYYLYMDIGKNEGGEVLVDFLRDFGNMWGKIVRKDQSFTEEEANWRVYRMPSEDWEDSLTYNGYIKKLIISTDDTQDCIEGCYLLLSIRISQIGEYVDDSKFYPFSILTKISPNNRAYTDIPKVVIQVDEYIIGNVDVSLNERISDFYEVWLPHDATRVEFDWQSGVAGLYINLGGIRPTTKNADFTLIPPGKDSVLYLTKEQIYEKAVNKKVDIPHQDSIEDLSLVIGVWTDKTSSVDTEIYSLRVHEVNDLEDKLDIIEVKADKKIMCKPHELPEGKYRCLFMVTYDSDDTLIQTPFFGHASSVDVSSMTYMYANFVNRDIYDELDNTELTRAIPTFETSTYNSKEDGVDYIYLRSLDKTKYLFINVIVDSKEDVMFLSNMPLYNYISLDLFEFYPTPGNEQLLYVSNEQLRLQFATENSIIVNIVTLTGEAEIFWTKDPSTIYSLRGRGDRLTLISGLAADHLVIQKRISKANQLQAKMEDPGFLFYISYYLKEPGLNFDEVIYGRSLEFGYIETDLPVVLYSKIGDYSSDINVAVTFKDLQYDESGFYPSSPLEVRASLIKENAVYKAKKDPELSPAADRLILGSYDTALKTAQVMLSNEIISTYNLKPSDNPTLYLSINKNFESSSKIYNKFNIEIQFSKANEGVIPTEKVYHYGRLGDKSRMTYYKLRVDKQKPFMRIQVAFNSNYTDFYVSDKFSWQRANMTDITGQKERGKIFVTLSTEKLNLEYIYLIFYQVKDTDIKSLYNYVFKYINAAKLDEFVDHKILVDENIEYKEIKDENTKELSIECSFHKIDFDYSKANITYFFKVVDVNSYLKGENYDTIAVMESPYYSVYARNPQDKDGLITLTAKGNLEDWTILQVIAQIQQETILEYVSYKGKYVYRESKKNDDNVGPDGESTKNKESSSSATMFYVVGGILLVLVIGLIVAIVIFKIRNQELVEQVKHVSFQKTNSSNYNNNNSNIDPNKLVANEINQS